MPSNAILRGLVVARFIKDNCHNLTLQYRVAIKHALELPGGCSRDTYIWYEFCDHDCARLSGGKVVGHCHMGSRTSGMPCNSHILVDPTVFANLHRHIFHTIDVELVEGTHTNDTCFRNDIFSDIDLNRAIPLVKFHQNDMLYVQMAIAAYFQKSDTAARKHYTPTTFEPICTTSPPLHGFE